MNTVATTAATARVPCLKTAAGQAVPLQSLDIRGHLERALAHIELVQRFRNPEEINVEAVYTFPLPVEAVLLGLSVRIADRTLVGKVAPREHAEAQYEQALSDGHTAVMLEQVEPGLFTLNLGNLMAGESAEIVLRYALPLRWEGDRLRLSLPTTLAPRYGDAARAGVQPHQMSEADALAEYPFRLTLCVAGEVEAAMVSSPTHRIRTTRDAAGLHVGIADDSGFADRDFVLLLRAAVEAQSGLRLARDGGNDVIAHAVFRVPERRADRPIRLKILVDCSGSMAGDSMALAKALAMRALDRLGTRDAFSLTAFGSTHRHHERGRVVDAASGAALVEARSFVGALDADLGGTEMLGALNAVIALGRSRGPAGDAEVLLITDGETWDREAIVKAARASGHRIFVIGVGSSPSEVLARGIAEATGGFASFVAPNEDVVPVIERHLSRMRLPRVREARLHLPGHVRWQSPMRLEAATFAGDTLHVFAALEGRGDAGEAHLDLHYADGVVVCVPARPDLRPDDANAMDLPRIAAAQRLWWAAAHLVDASQAELTDLAVRYQLMSPYTNYLLVHERGEQAANDLPELRKVPGTLAAGWGGTGTTVAQPKLKRAAAPMGGMPVVMAECAAPIMDALAVSPMKASLDARVFSRSAGGMPVPAQAARQDRRRAAAFEPSGLEGLAAMAVPARVIEGLESLIALGYDEHDVVLAFLAAVLNQPTPLSIDRAQRRRWLAAIKGANAPETLSRIVSEALRGCTAMAWAWSAGSVPAAATP